MVGLNSEVGGAIGNTVLAFVYAGKKVAEREVLSTSVEQLRSDLILEQAEVRSLQEEMNYLRDYLAAEQARTALLMGVYVDLQDSTLTPERRSAVVAEGMAALRQTNV